MTTTRVLVLCHANRWRSPLAAALLKQNPELEILSAGFKQEPGRRAGRPVRDAARLLRLDLEEHRSTAVTLELVRWAQYVLYMDGGNHWRLQKLARAPMQGQKWGCLGSFADPVAKRIPDLAFIRQGTPEFGRVVALIVNATSGFVASLK